MGHLPQEFMVMAIGVKADHIFQGIIYGKPRHPLLRQAIQHAFGRQVFAAKANLDYMIYCKFQNPRVGWNISPTYGPIYLFQERHDRKKSKIYDNEGHLVVTAQGMTVAFWKWQKGFQGDPCYRHSPPPPALPEASRTLRSRGRTSRPSFRKVSGTIPSLASWSLSRTRATTATT